MGHVVSGGKVRMEEDKVKKVREAERPKTKKQTRSFLGLTGYYRDYIEDYSKIAAPLTDLTKKGNPDKVNWGGKEEDAFQLLKQKLISGPILRMPKIDESYILRTDASDIGVGAVLLQEFQDGLFPIAYASKKLLPREQNYSVIERECLGIVFGVNKFQRYLYGKMFTLQTDHAPLGWLMRSKLQNARCMRWALYLQAYRFNIEVIKGKENVGSDYLSRLD